MESDSDILDTLNKLIVKDVDSVSLYLIKRTSSEERIKKFSLSAITIDGDVSTTFNTILKNQLKKIKNNLDSNNGKIRGFYDEVINSDDISQLEPKEIPGFTEMITKMESFTEMIYIKNLREGQKFDFYTFEFKLGKERILLFRKVSYKRLISKDKGRNWFRFTDGIFTKISGDVFTFDEQTDCIYVESTDSLLVLDKTNTENMFGFKDYYIKYAKGKLKNLQKSGLINISEKMLNLEHKIQLCKKITGTDKNDRFNKTINDFEKCYEILKEDKEEYREDLTQIDIKDGKLIIDSDEKLEAFVHLSNQDIVRDLMINELFVSHKKESLRKKTRTKKK